jgi:cell division protein FtsQ
MAGRYKISIRKILQVFFTLVVTVGCGIAITSASRMEDDTNLKGHKIEVESDKLYQFLQEKEVEDKIATDRGIVLDSTNVSKLDIAQMEQILKAEPWIEHATLYIDNKRILHIEVKQRIPVARLFLTDGSSYFMDKSLKLMPVKPNYSSYYCVVTNVPVLGNDSASTILKNNIWALLKTIRSDTFWNAQISQVAVDSGNTFQLIPVLGSHVIKFGDTSRMKEKFSNLLAFYRKVLNRIGWDRYDVLDVRFRGQIVASPELKYKITETKNTMDWDWVTAYVTQEKKKDSSTLLQETKPRYERPVIVKKHPDGKHADSRKPEKNAAGGNKNKSRQEAKDTRKEKNKPAQKAKEHTTGKPKATPAGKNKQTNNRKGLNIHI